MRGRRYCSVACRQKLRHQLNIRSGLLKALNTQYATFYFTDEWLIMDLLPYDRQRIFSFIYPRSHTRKPVEDFASMANVLGNAWWSAKRQTRRSYLATRHLLQQADRKSDALDVVRPVERKVPAIKNGSRLLLHLNIGREDLHSPALKAKLKSAYRCQAKRCHPDLGGDEETFRKIHAAYEELVKWAETPTFLRRHGFPFKWFYDGCKNRWVQPAPLDGPV